jgi:Xylose isomerase-like TIM barrel
MYVYGVHNVELQHTHFASTESSYLKEFRGHIEKVNSRMTQINVEFDQMNISAADPVQRDQAIDLTMRWVDHAVILNCPRVMINQGRLTPDTLARATAALKLMGDYAKTKGVKISVETRGGGGRGGRGGRGAGGRSDAGASNAATAPAPPPLAPIPGPPAWQLVKQLVEGSGTYSNVDIGGVGAADQESLHVAIKGLFPSSSGNMHIKTSPNWDLGTAIRFTNSELGYKGLYSIEVNTQRIREVYETILDNI